MIESEISSNIQCENIQEAIDYITQIRLSNSGSIIFYLDTRLKDKDVIIHDLMRVFPTAKLLNDSSIEVNPEVDIHIETDNVLNDPPLKDNVLCHIVALIINEFLTSPKSNFQFSLLPKKD